MAFSISIDHESSFPWSGEFADWRLLGIAWKVSAVSPQHSLNHFTLTMAMPYKNQSVRRDLELSFSSEVITGWRAWTLVDFHRRGGVSETRLKALGTPIIWEPYQAGVATCTTKGTHEAPWPDCRCGFWAFKERESVERALHENYGGEKGKVIGQIALWGRVLEGVNGYRGEYAYPQTLQFVEVNETLAQEVSDLYGVPYSIVKRSVPHNCRGEMVATEYDGHMLFATLAYSCGIMVRVELSRNWHGKAELNVDKVPPCPMHS